MIFVLFCSNERLKGFEITEKEKLVKSYNIWFSDLLFSLVSFESTMFLLLQLFDQLFLYSSVRVLH